eukprot:SAG31_NODE_441_length_15661_cov_17.905423_19_plen_109_part_00
MNCEVVAEAIHPKDHVRLPSGLFSCTGFHGFCGGVNLCWAAAGTEQFDALAQPALDSLVDVQSLLLEDCMSFRLVFTFAPNDYFTNGSLEKTYHLIDDDEPILEKAEG